MPPTDIQDILESKIAELEELAGKLKALSEFKQRIAEDEECPPENPERFRQKALEHKHDAIAALTAASTLKVILAARTKAEQIALMRHYILEFGQSASRNAKLSNTLADSDPRKEKVDQDGLSGTLVVATLNGILNDIGSETEYIASEPQHVAPSSSTTNQPPSPSMAGRLGQVLSWIANIIALAVLVLFMVGATSAQSAHSNEAVWIAIIGVVLAVVIWGCGRGLRYILAGT